ncbi:hypothetical protein DXG01_007493 [Tephrocybe rancida]|nr:hypothetical protein DXG01_007493 [Tephrocybe rancida]
MKPPPDYDVLDDGGSWVKATGTSSTYEVGYSPRTLGLGSALQGRVPGEDFCITWLAPQNSEFEGSIDRVFTHLFTSQPAVFPGILNNSSRALLGCEISAPEFIIVPCVGSCNENLTANLAMSGYTEAMRLAIVAEVWGTLGLGLGGL